MFLKFSYLKRIIEGKKFDAFIQIKIKIYEKCLGKYSFSPCRFHFSEIKQNFLQNGTQRRQSVPFQHLLIISIHTLFATQRPWISMSIGIKTSKYSVLTGAASTMPILTPRQRESLQQLHKIMRNYAEELCETSDSQPYHVQHPSQLSECSSDCSFNIFTIFSLKNMTNETLESQTCFFKSNREFRMRTEPNIVLKIKNQQQVNPSKTISVCKPKKQAKDDKKVKAKPIQKESRNVYSNVLRIFFKSILQLGAYDATISRIIYRSHMEGSRDGFVAWLLGFGVNFKNYIRTSQIKRILEGSDCPHYKRVLLILLRHYLKDEAVRHCLTSKRIELSSLKMHLSGLKDLYQEATKMKCES